MSCCVPVAMAVEAANQLEADDNALLASPAG